MSDFNTRERLRAFEDCVHDKTGERASPGLIHVTGYEPDEAETAIAAVHGTLDGLPDVLFVNSTIAFEGVFRFLRTLDPQSFHATSIGCYDWDPFLEHLQFPVSMVRQDAESMIRRAFELLEAETLPPGEIVMVRPELFLA
jgi:LacI family transcriptional regulator, fructose operon transcriptional repressor